MIRRCLAVAALTSVTACATAPKPEAAITVQRQDVIVTASCAPAGKLDLNPTFPDTNEAVKAAPGPAERYQLMGAGRILRDQWIKEALPVLKACQ